MIISSVGSLTLTVSCRDPCSYTSNALAHAMHAMSDLHADVSLDPPSCCLGPGVGAELAEAILRAYPTPLALRQAYEAAMRSAAPGRAVREVQGLLAGLHVNPARRVSAAQSAKVFDSLFAAGWHCV